MSRCGVVPLASLCWDVAPVSWHEVRQIFLTEGCRPSAVSHGLWIRIGIYQGAGRIAE